MATFDAIKISNAVKYGVVNYVTLSGTIRDAAEELIPGVVDIEYPGADGFKIESLVSTDGTFSTTLKGDDMGNQKFRLTLRSDESGNSPEVFDQV